jgi:hypothetical protein
VSEIAPDPWTINYFDPPTPHTPPPSPKTTAPKPVPQIEDLFRVQRDTLKVLNAIEELEHALGKDHKVHHQLHALKREAENAYKVINTYLKHQTQGTF